MNPVVEQFRAPNQTGPGPHQVFLNWLLVGLQTAIAEIARRLNQTAPKDGSELQRMVSLEPADFTVSANVNNADPGYFAVIRCDVTGADRTLSGLVDGAGQEAVGGRTVTLMNVGTGGFDLIVSHEDTNSLVGNRFKLPRGFGVTIAPEMAMMFWYDLKSLRWRVI